MSPEEQQEIQEALNKIAELLPETVSHGGFSFILFMLAKAYKIEPYVFLTCALNSHMNLLAEKERQKLI